MSFAISLILSYYFWDSNNMFFFFFLTWKLNLYAVFRNDAIIVKSVGIMVSSRQKIGLLYLRLYPACVGSATRAFPLNSSLFLTVYSSTDLHNSLSTSLLAYPFPLFLFHLSHLTVSSSFVFSRDRLDVSQFRPLYWRASSGVSIRPSCIRPNDTRHVRQKGR